MGGFLALVSVLITVVIMPTTEPGIRIKDVQENSVTLTAFQKKPEFGCGLITATHLEMKNLETPYFVEEKSTITINQQKINTYQENVKKILYDVKDEKNTL